MKIKNLQINKLTELLWGLSLKGKQSRMRTKFLKQLATHYEDYVLKGLDDLKEDYIPKDENGNIIYVDEEKQQVEVPTEYFKQEKTLLNEYYIVDLTESNKDILLTVADILLEGEFDIKEDVATFYDEWCNEFEQVLIHYNS